MKLSGWGAYPRIETELAAPRDEAELAEFLVRGDAVARGNGRAYGDAAIGRRRTLSTRHFAHMLDFDAERGWLTADSGVLLSDVISAFLPRGWFPLVTPGTKYVTLGGMVASDVHGKNHHKDGSFQTCVEWFDLMTPDGRVQRCSRTENSELFFWTFGAMGMTGVVLRVCMRLLPVETGWIRQKSIVAGNLAEAIRVFEDNLDATYSVAWIDCVAKGADLGRSIIMLGEHATIGQIPPDDRHRPLHLPVRGKLSVPFTPPAFCLNRYTLRAFNALYFRMGARKAAKQGGVSLEHWDSYFYPLDSILGWNRIYGRRGFLQYQCVIPLAQAEAGMSELMEATAEAGAGSFLAVLKRFGAQESRISFPMEGYTLALDFPASERNLALIGRLEDIAIAHGGRFYLAKDAHLTAARFRASEPRAEDFARTHRQFHPMMGSALSDRIGL
ncbi:FAD-binding oxidoreductase [Paenirhodobacter populi]|uniref:FAD-binding oxidoreductase n=1 Tax=Paenirhodobacter populi TaxID=2306993 RepID=A0A443JBB6_9RHOB|nr:FAD-binding oxidoreductase [Sinirhodobacter populi]RWR17839.1 FAD-binding oxidoreductase [Sinirhodobacter populi]